MARPTRCVGPVSRKEKLVLARGGIVGVAVITRRQIHVEPLQFRSVPTRLATSLAGSAGIGCPILHFAMPHDIRRPNSGSKNVLNTSTRCLELSTYQWIA